MAMEFDFRRTDDYAEIATCITEPSVFRQVSDDGAPPPQEYWPAIAADIWYVRCDVRAAGIFCGVFALHPKNAVTWEVHTCLRPIARGMAGQIVQALIPWIWENIEQNEIQIQRLVTQVPDWNRLALKLAGVAGMTEYGRNPASWLKNGILHDVIELGISRPCQSYPASQA